VEADPARIARHFAALCPLQPVRMEIAGLVCAPRAAPELAAPALAACPLPLRALEAVPAWPDPPAAMLAGWYRRSPGHLPAPGGLRELVQAPGEGFGPGDHATTAMCLAALEGLPAAEAVDAGCGSGLLAQAWAVLHDRAVLAVDLDPRALDQAARSLRAAGLRGRVALRQGPLEHLAPDELGGRVLLANVPLAAHRALAGRIGAPPRAAIVSGIRAREEEAAARAAYAAAGLRACARAEAGGFLALTLEGRP
jgi:ribosomal protein L11 methyltransferase